MISAKAGFPPRSAAAMLEAAEEYRQTMLRALGSFPGGRGVYENGVWIDFSGAPMFRDRKD